MKVINRCLFCLEELEVSTPFYHMQSDELTSLGRLDQRFIVHERTPPTLDCHYSSSLRVVIFETPNTRWIQSKEILSKMMKQYEKNK